MEKSLTNHPWLAKMCQKLWARACMWEGHAPNSMFVVFSPNNPFALHHNTIMARRFELAKHEPRY